MPNLYLCAKDAKRAEQSCPVHQVPAGEIERAVREQIKKLLQSPTILIRLTQVLNLPGDDIARIFREDFWAEITPGEMNRLFHLLLEQVTVFENKLSIELKSSGVQTLIEEIVADDEPEESN